MKVVLPWPPKELSSNYSNGHRVRRIKAHAAKKGYRQNAHWMALVAGIKSAMPQATLRFTYHPPDRRRRDVANLAFPMKAAIDGIADAMGCDDSGFRPVFPPEFAEVVKDGRIVIEVEVLG